MHTNMRFTQRLVIVLLLVLTMLGSGLQRRDAYALAQTFDLYAVSGTTILPDGEIVPVWGYTLDGSPVTKPGGPTLVVTQGDTVSITLHNTLGEDTALLIHGQAMPPDLNGVAAGGTTSYFFSADSPGTFLYEAGLLANAQHQVPMGLYGALVVLPSTPGQAYDASTTFDNEAVIVLSEIDPALNADPANFDMREFHPHYWLINGEAFPDTDWISTAAGNDVLLRYVNAGIQQHSMGLLGLRQRLIAVDGYPLTYPRFVSAETIPPGTTLDAIATIPASAADGSMFSLFEANFLQHNNGDSGFGGMLTFLSLSAVPPVGDTSGPKSSAVLLTPNKTNGSADVALSATISDDQSGNSDVQAAEYYVDSTAGTAIAMTTADSAGPTRSFTATITVADMAALSAGSHTIYVRGQDAGGHWGAFTSAALVLDKLGPTITGSGFSKNPSNGSVDVVFTATANDNLNGASAISAAEYNIDGGTAVAMTVATPGAAISSVSATIPAATIDALSEGTHVISVRSQDSLGNWGDFGTNDLILDKTGPETSNVAASPNPNNGTLGFNSSTPAVRLTASFADTFSKMSAAEAFIDTVGVNGTGINMFATDGNFNAPSETGYVNIPLTTVNALSAGDHTLYVHGKDSSGNWGPTSSMVFTVEKAKPLISGLAVTPNPTNPSGGDNATITLTGTATDLALGDNNITRAEWYDGADPGVGNGNAMAASDGTFDSPTEGLTADINFVTKNWAAGNHTVFVRARDAAGNWSNSTSFVVNVVLPNSIFADSFQVSNLSAWDSVTGTNISATAASSLNGSPAFGMRTTLNGNATRFVTDLTPLAATSYHARFYFDPNGAIPTGNNSANGVTIFAGLRSNNAVIFRVQFRRQTSGGGTYQIRLSVTRAGGTTNSSWYTISNAPHAIEISWASGTSATARLYVDGVARRTLTGLNTSAFLLETVRLGPSAGLVNSASGTLYFDAFISTRNTVIGP
ncbi:MAG: multicopper oxidase domain-containing protein [Chloroflexota bacterium]